MYRLLASVVTPRRLIPDALVEGAARTATRRGENVRVTAAIIVSIVAILGTDLAEPRSPFRLFGEKEGG